MFSLIVSSNPTAWETDQLMRMFAERFNECSGADAAGISLDRPATLQALEGSKALLMYETGTTGENADSVRYGLLRDIRPAGQYVTFRFTEEGRFTRATLREFGDRLGIDATFEYGHTHWAIKDGEIPSAMMTKLHRSYDVFISHATEDKDSFVRPLAASLTSLGLKVWFDEWTLTLGDSLRQKIDEGLAASEYGVVVLSRSFFAKSWPRTELDGLFAREMQGRKVILPVWHDVTKEEVLQYSAMLAAKLAAPTDEGVAIVADKIYAAVRPGAAPNRVKPVTVPTPTRPAAGAHKGGRYSIELGKRHRQLREKLLKINSRRMAAFYGFEKVAQLEACERGDDEFPTAAIKKLREFFFVNQKHLEEGSSEVFDSFEVTCSADDCKKFLAQGFEPFLLCLNQLRDQMMCYPVLHKEEDGLARVIVANSYGYFASAGGGKSNIMHFIEAIQEKGIAPFSVPIQKVDRKTWDSLEEKTFYFTGIGRFLGPDDEAKDCFTAWFEEFTRQNKPKK